tara:strand:+ start:406 stop:639 length:234 start_codon:yes stop_codon:yes gene_type:complete
MSQKPYRFFKELSEEEEATYREWARDNYDIGDPIPAGWHPAVIDECMAMLIGKIEENYNGPKDMGGEDGSGDEDSNE